MTSRIKLRKLDAIRKKAGLQIDPKTAELHWAWGQIADPYGDLADLPEECYCIGRVYFARAPESGSIWVEFGDLPEATRDALRERMEQPVSRAPRSGSDDSWPEEQSRVFPWDESEPAHP